jgi:hypothetical protein
LDATSSFDELTYPTSVLPFCIIKALLLVLSIELWFASMEKASCANMASPHSYLTTKIRPKPTCIIDAIVVARDSIVRCFTSCGLCPLLRAEMQSLQLSLAKLVTHERNQDLDLLFEYFTQNWT